MTDRYSRQILFREIGEEGQRAITQGRVAVMGMGALGTVIANSLARAGVGYLRLIDRDYVEMSNLQRQILYDEDDAAQCLPKAVAAARHLKKVNSTIAIEPIVADINPASVVSLIRDVDIILDGTDNLETRLMLNDACDQNGIPWIYGAAVASFGTTMNIIPGKTPCLRCLHKNVPPPGTLDTCSSAGVLGMITGIVGCLESAETLKFLVGSEAINRGMRLVDVWHCATETIEILKDPECPTCGKHRYEYLDAAAGTFATSLCGKGAFQVVPANTRKVDFITLAARLQGSGQVALNPFLLRFSSDKLKITVFSDGRAIIKGATSADAAKSIYAEYIGL